MRTERLLPPCALPWALLWALLAAAPAAAAPPAHGLLAERMGRLERRLAEQPDDPLLWLERCELHREDRDFEGAFGDIARAERLAPGLPETDLARARLMLDAGWTTAAHAVLTRCIESLADGESPPRRQDLWCSALDLRADTRMRLGAFDLAAEDCALFVTETARSARPEPDAYLRWARAVAANRSDPDRVEHAQVILRDGMTRFGPIPGLMQVSIELLHQAGHYAEALAQVDHALTTSRRLERLHLLRGEILLELGRRDEAQRAWRTAVTTIDRLRPRQRTARTDTLLAEVRNRLASLED